MTASQSIAERWWIGTERLFESELTPFAWVLMGFGVLTLVELAIPAERGQSWTGRGRNLVLMAIYVLVGLSALALWYTLSPVGSGASRGVIRAEALLLVPGYLFVSDFAYYWYHRAQHRLRPLWAIHELHHADAELNVTTSYRTYWLEAPVQSILLGMPVLFLFDRPGARFGLIALVASRFILLFAHCNLRLSLGRLTPFICGPQWHRIHHSRLAEHQDRNFAQVFPVIDWMFGTYYAPAVDEYPPTGTVGLASDAPLWRTQVRPFAIWRDEIFGGSNPGRSHDPAVDERDNS